MPLTSLVAPCCPVITSAPGHLHTPLFNSLPRGPKRAKGRGCFCAPAVHALSTGYRGQRAGERRWQSEGKQWHQQNISGAIQIALRHAIACNHRGPGNRATGQAAVAAARAAAAACSPQPAAPTPTSHQQGLGAGRAAGSGSCTHTHTHNTQHTTRRRMRYPIGAACLQGCLGFEGLCFGCGGCGA
jgi:hypothetical protein